MAESTYAMSAQKLAKRAALEKRARSHRVKLQELSIFTSQLAAMLSAGLPIVSALEALQEQTDDEVFRIIIREIRNDIAAGSSLSDAARKFPHAFNQLFVSMVEAGEASGNLSEILAKTGGYFEASVKLMKKVKSAMAYPVAVIGLAVVLVAVLLIFVIPVFENMFADFGADLPIPTKMLIALSNFLVSYGIFVVIGLGAAWWGWGNFTKTPRGRIVRDTIAMRLPIFGKLLHRIALSRFCRTYATLVRSGVPILRTLEIVSSASGRTQIEKACADITRHVTAGGQVSEVLMNDPFFPTMMRHMVRAGEQVGNVDGMLAKVADFYDTEAEALIAALTSLIEPILIVFLGVVIGGIVMSMFLPIFQLAAVAGGINQN